MAEQQQPDSRDRVAGESPSPLDKFIAELRLLTPQAFSEDRVDFEKLRELLADELDEQSERFSFTWAGRRDAVAMLQAPTSATLVPDTVSLRKPRSCRTEACDPERTLHPAQFCNEASPCELNVSR